MTAKPPDVPDGPPERRSILANTSYSLLVQTLSALFTVLLTLYLVRALSPHAFGVLGLALSIGGLVILPAEFGVTASASRYVAQHYDDRQAISEISAAALRLKFFLTGGVCLLLALLAPFIADLWDTPDLVWPIRIIAVVTFAQSTQALLSGLLNAVGRVDLNLWVVLTDSLVETTLAIALVAAGAGTVGALTGRALGFATGATVGLLILGRRLHVLQGLRRGKALRPWTGRLVRYGGALLVVDSAFALFSQIDILLIGAFLTTSAVAVFAAPLRFIVFLMLPAIAITAGVAYRMGRESDWQHERTSLVRATRHVLVVQGFMVAPLLVWATPIADVLFGRGRYAESAHVLRALVPFVFLSGFGNLFSLTANYLGQARRRVPIAVVTVVMNVVIDILLIPRIGVIAGAIGTDVAYAFYAPAHMWICMRILGFSLAPLARPALSVLGATAAMSLVLFLFGTGHLGFATIIVGAIAATLAYVAIVLLTGALTRTERNALRLKLRALVGRSRLEPSN